MIDYKQYLDSEIWAFIEQTGSFYPDDTASRPVAEQRKIYNRMCCAFHPGRPETVTIRDWQIGPLSLRDYSTGGGSARVLFFHGGGFVVGNLDSHDDLCAELCARTAYDVTAVDYRLAPEHPFPSDFNDALSAWNVLAETDRPIILVGDSAGGALCAGLSHALRSAAQRPVGQVLIYPGLGAGLQTHSMIAHANAPMLTRADCIFYKDARIGGDLSWLADPRCCPLSAHDFSNLPSTVAFSAECDPLADDARLYVDAMQAAGGDAQWVLEAGLVHGYLRARHNVARAKASFERIVEAVMRLGQQERVH